VRRSEDSQITLATGPCGYQRLTDVHAHVCASRFADVISFKYSIHIPMIISEAMGCGHNKIPDRSAQTLIASVDM
jgi:hypothetical protein